MLGNLIEESANNPGTNQEITLLGAPTGRMPFLGRFANNEPHFYVLTDGVQTEWGTGFSTAGSPNKMNRLTVLGNSNGTTARLNFTGACRVYNELPAERAPFFGADFRLPHSAIPGSQVVVLGKSNFQSIPNSVATAIVWSNKITDTMPAAVDPGTSTWTNIVLFEGGIYSLRAQIVFGTGTAGSYRELRLIVNGSPYGWQTLVTANQDNLCLSGACDLAVAPGAIVGVQVYHTSGAAIQLVPHTLNLFTAIRHGG